MTVRSCGRHRISVAARASLVAAAVAGVVVLTTVGAGAGEGADPIDRVLVVSLPTVAWTDLEDQDLPNLEALLDESAIADLSTRAVVRRTTAGDGYTTLNAGTRARGDQTVDGLAFGVDEGFEGTEAFAVFERRTGTAVDSGLVSLALPRVVAENEDLDFGAEVGALGDALASAGIDAAVVANADGADQANVGAFGRAAVLGLMTGGGTVPHGAVDAGLLTRDPTAPFGRRLDNAAVDSAFAEAFTDGSVVMVEASDLVRADDHRGEETARQRRVHRAQALAASDDLVGRLLDHVDPRRDAVLVVGPFHKEGSAHLTIAGLRAPGLEPGLMKSAVTRRAGFVTLVDVAPTILDLVDVDRPDSMEGRPFERAGTGGSAADRRAFLAEADEAAQWRDDRVAAVATAFVVAQLLLWLAAVWALHGDHAGRRRGVRFAALAVLGVLPATYLAALLDFHTWPDVVFWSFLVGTAVVSAGVATALLRRWPGDPLIGMLGFIAGLLCLDILLGGSLQLNTVFGYTPTVAGRFAGLGNLAFAQLVAAATILAGLLASRIGGRRGAVVGIAVVVAALIIDGSPFWGSDVGGVLTLVPTVGVMAALLFGWALRWRTAAAWAVAAVVVMVIAGFVDLARPEESRTHLGRLFEDIGNEGFAAFETVVVRKVGANLAVLTSSEWTLMLPVVFGFILYLIWRAPGRLDGLRTVVPQERAARIGFVVAAVLGFALNDSGIAVPGLMLGVMNASLVYLVVRSADPPWSDVVAGHVGPSDLEPAADAAPQGQEGTQSTLV